MFNGQLELSFGTPRAAQPLTCRVRRMSRAQWWFERMRQIVEHAAEPVPMPPPEQAWFSNACRQPAVAPESPALPSRRPSEERQIRE